ncbi:MAG: hypothetical protein J6Q67_08155, partial [Clostridia bacterium]|nr:hypothetical protein [Clostridia bacterium]
SVLEAAKMLREKPFESTLAERYFLLNEALDTVKDLPDGTITKLAQKGDTDGFNGELDQPGEPIIWNGSLVVSCFDTVVNDVVVNTKHELPATLGEIKQQSL